MGSDDLFKKKKAARAANQLERKRKNKEFKTKILIVCEGEKTEPFYFEELRKRYRLNTADIEIVHPKGSDPMSVFEKAERCSKLSKKEGYPYDRVFCVFDKDSHKNLSQALHKMRSNGFEDILSVPCFEYWFILHFCYTCSPFSPSESKSAADNVIIALKKHLPDYEKKDKSVFGKLEPHLPTAIKNARQANQHAESHGTDNPSTKVVDLVEFLINLNN